ncbi:PiggyBac transposable element-derived protein 3 [Plakobranchus ocellatus]|uniref:PiggyBac transposable element-derived protein 3 n=1 Tax=Plakobranchus ocellatus TaxID=259542 RepID=A0AAV3Y5P5_9GAST|nr:PiggyBac transposable element-derived protein 3 [Plakobranchus ocellatus]
MDYRCDPDTGIVIVRWNDNSAVTVGSTQFGVFPTGVVSRWSKRDRKQIQVPIPRSIAVSNKTWVELTEWMKILAIIGQCKKDDDEDVGDDDNDHKDDNDDDDEDDDDDDDDDDERWRRRRRKKEDG